MARFFLTLFFFLSSLPPLHLFTTMLLHYLGRHQSYTSPLPVPLQLFTSYSTERNCIFLFCNCILTFLIANSDFTPNSHFGSSHPTLEEFTPPPPPAAEVTVQFQTGYEKKLSPAYRHDDQEQVEDEDLGTITDDQEEQIDNYYQTGQDHGEERIEVLMNVDELNKKCEEFIRKMRKQIGN